LNFEKEGHLHLCVVRSSAVSRSLQKWSFGSSLFIQKCGISKYF